MILNLRVHGHVIGHPRICYCKLIGYIFGSQGDLVNCLLEVLFKMLDDVKLVADTFSYRSVQAVHYLNQSRRNEFQNSNQLSQTPVSHII